MGQTRSPQPSVLGYWIRGHQKMDYKRRFHPLQAYDGRTWRAFDDAAGRLGD